MYKLPSHDATHIQAKMVYLPTQVVYVPLPRFEHLLETFEWSVY